MEALLGAVKQKISSSDRSSRFRKKTVIRALLKRLGCYHSIVLCPTHKARAAVSAGLPGARMATVATTLRLRPSLDG